MSLKTPLIIFSCLPLVVMLFVGGYEIALLVSGSVMNYCYANGLADKALAMSIAAGVGILQATGILAFGLIYGLVLKYTDIAVFAESEC